MNPLLLSFLRPFLLYALIAALGAYAAWEIQGVRLDAANNEFTDYKQEQTRLRQEARDEADAQRRAADASFARKSAELADSIQAGDVFRRCVAAGKCGRMSNLPANTGIRLPAAGQADAAGQGTVPAAGEPAPGVVADCAYDVLQLNELQSDIRNQPGYAQ